MRTPAYRNTMFAMSLIAAPHFGNFDISFLTARSARCDDLEVSVFDELAFKVEK